MGLLSGIVGAVKGIGGVIDKLHTSAEEKMELKVKFQALLNEVNQAQTQVNLQDAKSSVWYQRGWRPFIGWTCGLGLAFCIFFPVIQYFVPDMPKPDANLLLPTVTGMLGIAGMRSYEKSKDLTR